MEEKKSLNQIPVAALKIVLLSLENDLQNDLQNDLLNDDHSLLRSLMIFSIKKELHLRFKKNIAGF